MSESYRFTVSGRVQGVFFRQSCKAVADQSGLNGWVRNRDDGRVEGVVSGGHAETIAAFQQWLKCGPPSAEVNDLQWQACEAEDQANGFQVRR